MNDITLANKKVAAYRTTNSIRIPDINPDDKTTVHIYNAPCPVCDHGNTAHSLDGIRFITNQIVCKGCGVFYRPAVDPEEAAARIKAALAPSS